MARHRTLLASTLASTPNCTRGCTLACTLAAALSALSACNVNLYDPALATRTYPETLEQSHVVQMQAVPRDLDLQIINATSTDYTDVDIWVNRRYVQHVPQLLAGATIDLQIVKFRDVWGQCPQPGGFWRTRAPTPLVFVQIQRDATSPLLGLVTVVPEAARY